MISFIVSNKKQGEYRCMPEMSVEHVSRRIAFRIMLNRHAI